jgi:membrane protease YdiL (CAAX protease family)
MNKKPISGYLFIVFVSFMLYLMKPANTLYYSLLPLLMLILPLAAGYRVKISFSIKDVVVGLVVSVVLLLPYSLFFGGSLQTLSLSFVIFQLLGVALPEEFFFRGFLQDSMGRNLKTVIIVSLLFSLAHLPRTIFLGEWMPLLSFFPSLVMGWLYLKTNNIIPGTLFHFLANLVYQN